jgi:hypothetical protein
LAQPVILSRWTFGLMYDSPARPLTLDTRMYPSIVAGTLPPDGPGPTDLSVASQFMDVNFLDGYRIELIERG